MTTPRHRQTFPKSARVRSRLHFAEIYEHGVRVSDGCLSLIAKSNGWPLSRLGLAVSKRCGNAVQRNRLKRRLREAFRQSRAELPAGLDLVIQPRADTPLVVVELRRSLLALSHRAAKKLSRRDTSATATSDANAERGA